MPRLRTLSEVLPLLEWSESSGVASLPSPSAMMLVSLPLQNYKECEDGGLDIAEDTGFSFFRSYI